MNKEHLTPEEQEADCVRPEKEETIDNPGNGQSADTQCDSPVNREPVETNCISPEAAELENRLLRLQAEFTNYRRRTERERLEQAVRAEASLVQTLLPVLDNFERALANLPAEADAAWIEGVRLVQKQLLDVLGQQGLERIDCEQAFDPNIHEAVMRQACVDDVAEGTILQELQPGFLYQGKLLRPSMVKVATKS